MLLAVVKWWRTHMDTRVRLRRRPVVHVGRWRRESRWPPAASEERQALSSARTLRTERWTAAEARSRTTTTDTWRWGWWRRCWQTVSETASLLAHSSDQSYTIILRDASVWLGTIANKRINKHLDDIMYARCCQSDMLLSTDVVVVVETFIYLRVCAFCWTYIHNLGRSENIGL